MPVLHGLWLPPPANWTLGQTDVHVWLVSLDQPATRLQQLTFTLSNDERKRADSFYFERDKQHFIASRGILRTILSSYLGITPHHIEFCYGPQGKPSLTPLSGWDKLRFNVSHSHGLALYAITREREIGVDLEYIRPIFHAQQIAERFFSDREQAVLRTLPERAKQQAFFTCWTRKEAYIKATGAGLAMPLDQFDVSLAPWEPPELLNIHGNLQEAARWSVRELIPAFGYVAALVVEGCHWTLMCWEWTEREMTSF